MLGIVIAGVAGLVVGAVFGKTLVSDAYSIKAHITSEIAALETRLKSKL